jgi:ABC-2 type transport system permease protein
MNYLKNKVFVGITLFFMIVIAAVLFAPRVLSIEEDEDTIWIGDETDEDITDGGEDIADGSEDASEGVMLLAGPSEVLDVVQPALAAAFPEYTIQVTEEAKIETMIRDGEAKCGIALTDLLSFTYYVENLSLYNTDADYVGEVLKSLYQSETLAAYGVTPEQVEAILSAEVDYSVETLGKDQMQNFLYTYIMIFALYMVILLYGSMVATNVATEKSSRAMELLITSANPTSMMFGKVLATCMAGFLQLLCIFGSAVLFYQLNQSYWGYNALVASLFSMPPELLLYMLLFFVLGVLLFAFMFGAVGSVASKVEDVNTSVLPVMMLFIVGFFLVITSITSGNVDTLLMKICSYLPFTSPMAMFARLAMSTVPTYAVLLSVGILVVSVVIVGILAAKIYRAGVLMYGTKPKLRTIIRMLRQV